MPKYFCSIFNSIPCCRQGIFDKTTKLELERTINCMVHCTQATLLIKQISNGTIPDFTGAIRKIYDYGMNKKSPLSAVPRSQLLLPFNILPPSAKKFQSTAEFDTF